MKLVFTLDTHGTCVGQLRDELLPLEELANTWKFPYDIFFVLRVLPDAISKRVIDYLGKKSSTYNILKRTRIWNTCMSGAR
ncbi:hypothetical protein D3C73_856680 [compost metagenome]